LTGASPIGPRSIGSCFVRPAKRGENVRPRLPDGLALIVVGVAFALDRVDELADGGEREPAPAQPAAPLRARGLLRRREGRSRPTTSLA
jgi:hypothetical protein